MTKKSIPYNELFYWLPDEFRYVAMDFDLLIYAYSSTPVISDDESCWNPRTGAYELINPFLITDCPSDWKLSLICRDAEKASIFAKFQEVTDAFEAVMEEFKRLTND